MPEDDHPSQSTFASPMDESAAASGSNSNEEPSTSLEIQASACDRLVDEAVWPTTVLGDALKEIGLKAFDAHQENVISLDLKFSHFF